MTLGMDFCTSRLADNMELTEVSFVHRVVTHKSFHTFVCYTMHLPTHACRLYLHRITSLMIIFPELTLDHARLKWTILTKTASAWL